EALLKKANKTNNDKQKEIRRVESQNTNKEEREKQAKIELEKIERKRGEIREEQVKIQINQIKNKGKEKMVYEEDKIEEKAQAKNITIEAEKKENDTRYQRNKENREGSILKEKRKQYYDEESRGLE
ncbi:9813_t:CDS:1, partial [Scutellospora calospora]